MLLFVDLKRDEGSVLAGENRKFSRNVHEKYVIPATFNPKQHATSKLDNVSAIVCVTASGRRRYCCLVQIV